jgi:hypothetical protein
MGICVQSFWYNFLGVWSGRVRSLDPPNYTNAISTFGLLSFGVMDLGLGLHKLGVHNSGV